MTELQNPLELKIHSIFLPLHCSKGKAVVKNVSKTLKTYFLATKTHALYTQIKKQVVDFKLMIK